MHPSILNMFSDVESPLLDYIAAHPEDQSPSAGWASYAERQDLDSGGLLQIFGPSLDSRTDECAMLS